MMLENRELQLAEAFVLYTKKNVFLTGKAGTGKTTFLKSLAQKSKKNMIVTAPTGVAAINARGVTLHSFFQLPFGPIITEKVAGKKVDQQLFKNHFSKEKIAIIKTLDLLIIDEISMVRADILDAVDAVLRRYKNRYLPFGGTQLLMIGDLQQLPPVVKSEESQILNQYYDSHFFFASKALKQSEMITIELKHIFRQSDTEFIRILNEIRDNCLSEASYEKLHKRYIAGFKPKHADGYITLTTHNHSAKEINSQRLDQLKGNSKVFRAVTDGTFSEYLYPADLELELKIGAQVMFIKNDSSSEKKYFNGKIGYVTGFEDESIQVKCENEPNEINVLVEKWDNIKYTVDEQTGEINEEVIGTFVQFPLRTAWAITIHKSQGLTFEKVVIDASAAFAHGQTYVALSRCKSPEGLILSSKLSKEAIICNNDVAAFNRHIESDQPDEALLEKSKREYQADLISELFDFKHLVYQFSKIGKLLSEHSGSFTGTLNIKIKEIEKNALPEIINIAGNFLKQLAKLNDSETNYESNKQIIERLKSAGQWFIDFQIDRIENFLENASFESDNKEIKKSVKEILSDITEILNVKKSGFLVCITGFNVQDLINGRAKSLVSQKEKRKSDYKPFKQTETKNSELYTRLRNWRMQRAEADGYDAYMILPNKSLQIIAESLPSHIAALKKIHGIGKKKLLLYADEILEIVKKFMIENNHDIPVAPLEIPEPEKKRTEVISFDLYKDGKSIAEIAKIRGFTLTTIENHLAKYIETGEIDVLEFIDSETLEEISSYFLNSPEAKLAVAKTALPDKYTWSQIKFVKNHLMYKTKEL